MASTPEFVEFIAEQLKEAGEIRYKKMFGEYGIYCDGKFFALVCDNRFFVKITENGKKVVPNCTLDFPYKGAKEMFLITDLDDRELLVRLTQATWEALPFPKPKTTKKK